MWRQPSTARGQSYARLRKLATLCDIRGLTGFHWSFSISGRQCHGMLERHTVGLETFILPVQLSILHEVMTQHSYGCLLRYLSGNRKLTDSEEHSTSEREKKSTCRIVCPTARKLPSKLSLIQTRNSTQGKLTSRSIFILASATVCTQSTYIFEPFIIYCQQPLNASQRNG